MSYRDVWKIYLEQEQYEMAKKYATGHSGHMDTILVCQAEHYFKEQRLVRAMPNNQSHYSLMVIMCQVPGCRCDILQEPAVF